MKDYRKIYKEVGSVSGWDFGKISKQTKTIGEKWDYFKLVMKYLNKDTYLLDIGTGGGEKLIGFAKAVRKAVGIDHSEEMVSTANNNLNKSGLKNVEFTKTDSTRKYPFSSNSFDLVICRHAPFNSEEIFRVLKTGGLFITQQVGEKDKENFKNIFGRGQSFGERAGVAQERYVNNLKKAGFKILRADTYNATEYYKDISDVIFLLRNTPIVNNLEIDKDLDYLKQVEDKFMTKGGIKTNSYRYLIIAKKQKRIDKLIIFEDILPWKGTNFKVVWHDTNSFDNLDISKCSQCYGVCFCGDKIVIGRRLAGHWGLIGGTIEKGETFEQTLRREIIEESNMRILSFLPIGYQEVWRPDGSSNCQLRFACKVEPIGKFESDPADGGITEIKLIDPKDYKKYFDWGKVGERIMKRAIELHKLL